MPRRPEEEGPEPEGGRVAERLRQHLESRFEPDDWPEDAPIDDVRDRPSGEGEAPDQASEAEEPEHDADDDAEEAPSSKDREEGEEPLDSHADQLNDKQGDD